MSSIAYALSRILPYALIAVLVLNLVQGRHKQRAMQKRLATLYLACIILALLALTLVMVRFDLNDLLLAPGAAFLAGVVWTQRRYLLPYRMRCAQCGAALGVHRILFRDSKCCEACESVARPQ